MQNITQISFNFSSITAFCNLNRTNSFDSLREHKSIDNLCFARKKLHRRVHAHEIYRPRCNTDPEFNADKPLRPLKIPILRILEDETSHERNDDDTTSSPTDTTPSTPTKHMTPPSLPNERKGSTSSKVLGSLLKQTIKVTTASMGFKAASMER